MTESENRFKPISIDPGQHLGPGDGPPHRWWVVDGKTRIRFFRSDERTGTTVETRELTDVKARLRQMDEMGVEVQVIYPTSLLAWPTTDPEWQAAICRSFNCWLAERTAESNGRLGWAIVAPVNNMEEALKELRFGKEHGAVGVFRRGFECGGKTAADPHFFPLYEEAMRLDLPVCIHVGGSFPDDRVARPETASLSHLAFKGIPQRFPTLRFGVIEAMASWIPYVIALAKAKGQFSPQFDGAPIQLQQDFFRSNRFYVTAQTSDDIPYLLTCDPGAEDGLMIGTDYGHTDQSSVMGALNFVEDLAEKEAISPEVARKILIDNPRAFTVFNSPKTERKARCRSSMLIPT